MENVGLGYLKLGTLSTSLSGGEVKRIEIAMIMARGTRLSIFDEPEAGIDLWSFQSLIHIFEHYVSIKYLFHSL